jgi:cysteine desulfurase
MIYADNAATTKLDINAFEVMKPYLIDEYGNASQPYSFSKSSRVALKKARETIATCINASPDEIFFTSGGTESDNWAIKGSAFGDVEKRATITSQIEHHAVLNACAAIERLGYAVAYLPVDSAGTVQPTVLESFISDRTRLVSIMFSNNEIGTIQPITELSKIAHNHGALFHTDAVQAVGHVNIDVRKLGVDMLSASAHKFNGPKGIGFLFVKKGATIIPYADGGAQEYKMRAGTENIPSIVGMASALQTNCIQIKKNTENLYSLEMCLLHILEKSGLSFIRNGANHIPGNLSLSFKGQDGEMLLHRLDLMGIAVSTGSACDSVNTQISHVLSAINLPENYANGTIRISFGKSNTKEEAETIGRALIKIIRE